MPEFRVLDDWPRGTPGGVCYLCRCSLRDVRHPGGLRREKVLDTGHVIDFEGPLCVCETCCVELGRHFGMVDADAVHAASAEVTAAMAAVEQAQAQATDLRIALAALQRAGWGDAERPERTTGDFAQAPSGGTDDRSPRIAALRSDGRTWDEVGEAMGLSGERCRQIAKAATGA